MKHHNYLRIIQVSLLCLIAGFSFQCSTEDEISKDFEYIDNVFAPHRITERELEIIEECRQTTITDSTALPQHVIGTWRLIGFSSSFAYQLPEYSYQQILFGSEGYGLMEFFSPSGIILNHIPFTWSTTSNANDARATTPRAWLISEPYIHDVVGLRFCEEYAYISFIDSNKLIFQKQPSTF